MSIKIDARDRWYSLLIRERAENRCEVCGNTETIQCAHIQGRRSRATRWHPDNALCLCYSHHRYFTERPAEFTEFVKNKIGEHRLASLIILSKTAPRYRKHDLEEIRLNLKAAHERMMMERNAGGTGRLEFDSPYPENQEEAA